MNARIVGRRVYVFRDVNIRMAFFHRRICEIDLLMISSANLKSLEQIGMEVWQRLLQSGRGEVKRIATWRACVVSPAFSAGIFGFTVFSTVMCGCLFWDGWTRRARAARR